MKRPLAALAAAAVMFIGGIVFVVMGFGNLNEVKNFTPVDVVVTDIEEETTVDSDGASSTTRTFYVDYTVEGQSYQHVILQYANGEPKIGDTVTARYDPDDPSYVTGATTTSGIVRIGFGALIMIAAVLGGIKTLIRGN